MKRQGMAGAVALAGVLAVAAVAPALAGGGPSTESVVATAHLVHEPGGTKRNCAGLDGDYSQTHETARGKQTSTDPRLTGDVVVEIDTLINDDAHKGTFEGTTRLLDTESGATKARGRVYGVVDGVSIRGFTVQRLGDGGKLMASVSGIHEPKDEPPHSVVIEFGGPAAVPLDLAQVQTGTCRR